MFSETAALEWMQNKFGIEFPREGMALAMGTHRWRASQWLINGVLRFDRTTQMSMATLIRQRGTHLQAML